MPRQFGECPDDYVPLEQAKLVADYVGGNCTVFDALEMEPHAFERIFIIASGKALAEVARMKKAKAKKG